jgi:phenylpropionate dioxygenase-like ring-hydroxylating dioxygenase large terminal subunit
MYDPDTGALKGAPRMCAPSKKKKKKKKKEEEEEEELGACGQPSPSFDKADFPLHPVRLREVSGFLFVGSATAAAATATTTTGQGGDTNAANAAPCDLSDSLGNLPRLLFDQWPMEDLVTVGRATYDVKCNWKFLLENTSETYHTAYVHRSTLGAMDSSTLGAMKSETESGVGSDESSSDEVPWGDWSGVYVPGDRSIVPLKGEDAPFPAFQRKTFFVSVFPTLQVNLTHDCAWWMRMLPTSEDRTLVTQGFLFPRATTELPGFQEKLEPYLRRWHLAVVEDNEISENQQLGAGSFEASFPGPAAYADLVSSCCAACN